MVARKQGGREGKDGRWKAWMETLGVFLAVGGMAGRCSCRQAWASGEALEAAPGLTIALREDVGVHKALRELGPWRLGGVVCRRAGGRRSSGQCRRHAAIASSGGILAAPWGLLEPACTLGSSQPPLQRPWHGGVESRKCGGLARLQCRQQRRCPTKRRRAAPTTAELQRQREQAALPQRSLLQEAADGASTCSGCTHAWQSTPCVLGAATSCGEKDARCAQAYWAAWCTGCACPAAGMHTAVKQALGCRSQRSAACIVACKEQGVLRWRRGITLPGSRHFHLNRLVLPSSLVSGLATKPNGWSWGQEQGARAKEGLERGQGSSVMERLHRGVVLLALGVQAQDL